MGEVSAVIIKNEGFAALGLDARIGDVVHSARLGSSDSALSLLGSRFAVVSVRLVDTVNSKIAESVTEVVVFILKAIKAQLDVRFVVGVTIEPRVSTNCQCQSYLEPSEAAYHRSQT